MRQTHSSAYANQTARRVSACSLHFCVRVVETDGMLSEMSTPTTIVNELENKYSFATSNQYTDQYTVVCVCRGTTDSFMNTLFFSAEQCDPSLFCLSFSYPGTSLPVETSQSASTSWSLAVVTMVTKPGR